MKTKTSPLALLTLILLIISCSNNEEQQKKEMTIDTKIKDSIVVNKGPIINIEDSIAQKQIVLCLKDSSNTYEGMKLKLGNIYNEKLIEVINKNKLQAIGAPMAWQSMQKDIYFFEAGIPVNKEPLKLGKGMYLKSTQADSAILAHFWGPLDQTKAAYDAISESLVDKKKTKISSYEIYRGSQFTDLNSDPFKQQTDIVVTYNSTKK